MKVNDFSILVVVVLFIFSISLLISIMHKERSNALKAKYDQFLSLATNDAMYYIHKILTEKDMNLLADGKAVITGIDKENALERFLKTLYLNMDYESYVSGISLKETIEDYVNFFAIVDYDGIWVNTKEGEDLNGYERVWQEKVYFETYLPDDHLILTFHLKDGFGVRNASTNEPLDYTLDELRVRYHNPLFEPPNFEDLRRKTIIDIVRRNLEMHSDKDENFYFQIPYIDDTFYNTIRNKSIIAFLKGVPLIGKEVYNTYAFSGVAYDVKKKYVGEIKNGRKVYHQQKIEDAFYSYQEYIFDSKKEAALNGFYPE